MAIDDYPLEVARKIIDAEERAKGPDLARKLAEAAAEYLPSPLSSAIKAVLAKDENGRLSYLFDQLEKEFRHLRGSVEQTARENEQQRRFMKEEFPPLLLDAFRKALMVRSKSRIKRLAAILANSLQRENPSTADEVEEFMSMATELTDLDVVVLGVIRNMQGNMVTGDGKRMSTLSWPQSGLDQLGIGITEVFSSAPKLVSFGLVRETDEYRRATGSPKPWPYALLPKGSRFLGFIHSQASDASDA